MREGDRETFNDIFCSGGEEINQDEISWEIYDITDTKNVYIKKKFN